MQGNLYVNTLPSLWAFLRVLLYYSLFLLGKVIVLCTCILKTLFWWRRWQKPRLCRPVIQTKCWESFSRRKSATTCRMTNTWASFVLRRLHQERQQRLRLSRVGKMSTNAMAGLNHSLPHFLFFFFHAQEALISFNLSGGVGWGVGSELQGPLTD